MRLYKLTFYCLCLAFIACNDNRNPYENSLGINPAEIAVMDTAHYTLIKWADSVLNFGTLKKGDSAHLKFSFKNTGEIPLFILSTQVTCGCTVAAFSKDAVMPGKRGFVTVSYKAGTETGEVNKKIVVISNTKNVRLSNLFIQGRVEQPASK